MELVGLPAVAFALVGTVAAVLVAGWGTFAMIHADEAKGRKRALEGASADELKQVERDLADVQRELKKRQTPNG